MTYRPATDTQLECARKIAHPGSLIAALIARIDEKQRDLTGMTDLVIELEDRLASLEKASQLTQDGGWIEWRGGECPVGARTEVEVKLRNGDQFVDVAGVGGSYALDWRHGDDHDIVAYRVLPPTSAGGA